MYLSELELPEFVINGIDAGIRYIYSFGPAAEKTVILGRCMISAQPCSSISAVLMPLFLLLAFSQCLKF